MMPIMICLCLSQSALAQQSELTSTVSMISIFQPIDVAADTSHIFVIHRTCGPIGHYQYNQGMTDTSYCPGFTASYCNFNNFQNEILSIDNSFREEIIASLPSPFGCNQKDHLAISSGLGGFSKGYIYLAQGSWAGVNIWKISSDGSHASLFKTNLSIFGSDIYITFDRTGSFGYDMIVAGGDEVWKIDSNGKASQLAEIPIRHQHAIGGVAVAPSNFGSYGGNILVPDPNTGNIFAISPHDTLSKISQWQGASEILFVPQEVCSSGKQDTVFLSSFASDTGGAIAMYPKTDFAGLVGSALLTNQYNPSIGLMTAGANGIIIKEFQSSIDTQLLEGSTFVLC